MESHSIETLIIIIMIISSNMTDFVGMLTLGVESLPDDMQRNISQMRELDLHYQGMM